MAEKEGWFSKIFGSKKGSCCAVDIEEITDGDNENSITKGESSTGCCNKSLQDTPDAETDATDIESRN